VNLFEDDKNSYTSCVFHGNLTCYYFSCGIAKLALHQPYNTKMVMIVFIMETNGTTREIFVWNYE
jgi:hypothetical protein